MGLTTYGRSSGFCVDPIEKKPLNHFLPGTPVLSFGTAGCNLTCKFCQNWDISKSREFDKLQDTATPEAIADAAVNAGCSSVAVTYNDPVIFMEYARNAVRMSSLMKQHSILVYTHDSIGQGEDGPTHQPVEQLAALRLTPDLSVWRPCDAIETAVAWKAALGHNEGPSALVFSRQSLPHQERSEDQVQAIGRGAYILKDCEGDPELIIIATGSEVGISRLATIELQNAGIKARLVSMPSVDVFESQDSNYQEQVLPKAVRKRVAVEASAADYWRKFVGLDGKVVGMNTFGESAPGPVLMEKFGFTVENVVSTAKSL